MCPVLRSIDLLCCALRAAGSTFRHTIMCSLLTDHHRPIGDRSTRHGTLQKSGRLGALEQRVQERRAAIAAKEQAVQDSVAKEQAAKERAAQEQAAKERKATEQAAEDLSAKRLRDELEALAVREQELDATLGKSGLIGAVSGKTVRV